MLTVVTGQPGSGKSYWVNQQAKSNDIIIDLDKIALAVSCTDTESHDYPSHIRDVAIGMRQAAISRALKYTRRCDVYIIHADPDAQTLMRYQRFGAVIKEMHTAQHVVDQRIRQRPVRNQALVGRLRDEQ